MAHVVRHGIVAAACAAAVLAGCESFDASMLQGMVEATKAVADYQSQRKSQNQGSSSGNSAAAAAPPPTAYANAAPAGYAPLACARLTVQRVGTSASSCVQNACGRPVQAHYRSSGAGTATAVVGATECRAWRADVQAAVACESGHGFDWVRGLCLRS